MSDDYTRKTAAAEPSAADEARQECEERLIAWETKIDDLTSITFAPTAAAAKFNTVRSYREAGYGRAGKWPNVTTKRLPILDDSPLKSQGRKCFTPEYALNYP